MQAPAGPEGARDALVRQLRLRDGDDVVRALKSPSAWFLGSPTIELGEAFGSERRRAATARRMSFWLRICGCQPGAVLALAILAWQGWSVYAHGGDRLWGLAGALGAALGAAFVAKLLSLLLSRGLFVLELLHLLAMPPAPAPKALP